MKPRLGAVAAVIFPFISGPVFADTLPIATYICNQFMIGSTAAPQFFGYIKILNKAEYGYSRAKDGDLRKGTFRYDQADREITWVSGMFKEYNWPAQFVPAGQASRPRPGFTNYTPNDPTIRFEAADPGGRAKILINCRVYDK